MGFFNWKTADTKRSIVSEYVELLEEEKKAWYLVKEMIANKKKIKILNGTTSEIEIEYEKLCELEGGQGLLHQITAMDEPILNSVDGEITVLLNYQQMTLKAGYTEEEYQEKYKSYRIVQDKLSEFDDFDKMLMKGRD